MPKKSTKAKATSRKRNLKVEDLPKSQQKVGKKEMKKVKGSGSPSGVIMFKKEWDVNVPR